MPESTGEKTHCPWSCFLKFTIYHRIRNFSKAILILFVIFLNLTAINTWVPISENSVKIRKRTKPKKNQTGYE